MKYNIKRFLLKQQLMKLLNLQKHMEKNLHQCLLMEFQQVQLRRNKLKIEPITVSYLNKYIKEKVAEVKAAAADPEVYVQYQGNESNLAVITERIKKQYVEEGHKESDIKSLKIYLKPEDASAYYVINDNNSGKVFLF